MNIILKIWRQANQNEKGFFEIHNLSDISEDMSFLEVLDLLNNNLIQEQKDPIAFDHDCREGICGTLREKGWRTHLASPSSGVADATQKQRSSAIGSWVPYLSTTGMFRSSMK